MLLSGASLYRLQALSVWSTGFGREASHIFPQGVLTTITLIGAGAGMEWVVLESGVRQYFPSSQACHYPIRSKVWSQVAGAEALRVPACSVFLECVFTLLPALGRLPQMEAVLKRGRPTSSWLVTAADGGPACLWCAACAGAWDCCPCSAQRPPPVQFPSVLHKDPFPQIPHMPCCGAGWGPRELSVSGCELWWSACLHCSSFILLCWTVAANHPTQALPWGCVISESHDQVSLVVAAQIQCHAMTWREQGWRIQSAWRWAHAEAVTGNPEAIRIILPVLCLPFGDKPASCTHPEQNPSFPQPSC